MDEQVSRQHYFTAEYNMWERWTSFAQQYQLVRNNTESNTSVLEIGPGNHSLTHILSEAGYDVTTADIADSLNPDVVADIRDLPFDANQFDAACAFEVLEHIPYTDVPQALHELHRVTKGPLFISLPFARMTFECSFKIPLFSRRHWVLSVPLYRFFDHEFDGEHYWEVGKKGYGRASVETMLRDIFDIAERCENPYNTYHLFYVLTP